MNSKMTLYLYLFVISFMVFVAGCATGGKYGKAVVSRSGVTIEELYKNWEDYNVYYQGASSSTPFGIIFDPKGDGRKLTFHEYWEPVKDQEELSRLIRRLQARESRMYVQEIIDPEKKVYGYLYTLPLNPRIKVVDHKTLWVDKLGW